MAEPKNERYKCLVCSKVAASPMNLMKPFFGKFDNSHLDYLASIDISEFEMFKPSNIEHLAECVRQTQL